jgi:hypothetical protein
MLFLQGITSIFKRKGAGAGAGERGTTMGKSRKISRKTAGRILYFVPKGRPLRYNPVQDWTTETGLSAVFYVGLTSRDKDETFRPQIVREVFLTARKKQDKDVGSSFIVQLGLYRDSKGMETKKDSVQIICVHLPYTGETGPEFQNNMLEIGEEIKRILNQESVILEFRERNKTVKVYGIVDDGVPASEIPYVLEEARIED